MKILLRPHVLMIFSMVNGGSMNRRCGQLSVLLIDDLSNAKSYAIKSLVFQILHETHEYSKFIRVFNKFSMDPDVRIRASAAAELLVLDKSHPQDCELLIHTFLNDNDASVRRAAMIQIEQRIKAKDRRYIPFIMQLVYDSDSEIRRRMVYMVCENIDFLPSEFVVILYNMSFDLDNEVRFRVPYGINVHFNKFESEIREPLILKLSSNQDHEIRTRIAQLIFNHYLELPEKTRKIVIDMSTDSSKHVRMTVADSIISTLNQLPSYFKKILFQLLSDTDCEVRAAIAYSICHRYRDRKIPKDSCLDSCLSKLMDDKHSYVRDSVKDGIEFWDVGLTSYLDA